MIVCLVGLCRREILVSHCLIRFLSILNCMRKITLVSSLHQLCPVFLILWLVLFNWYFMNSVSIISASVNLNASLKSQVTLIYYLYIFCTTAVLCVMHTHINSLYSMKDCRFKISLGHFHCFVCVFVVFFSLFWVTSCSTVQVIVWKGSSLNWPNMWWAGTHSLTHSVQLLSR